MSSVSARARKMLLPILLLVLSAACATDPSLGDREGDEDLPGILTIRTYPGDTVLTVGDTVQFRAESNYQGEKRFTWNSRDPSILEVTGEGLVRALAPGAADIVVSLEGADLQGVTRVTVAGQ